jgi:lysozyme family protein
MSDFEPALKVILEHAGGWASNPADPGGETNFGISMQMIRREELSAADLGIDDWTPGCLKKMTVETAGTLLRKLYWDKYAYGLVSDQKTATKLFDCAVNCGPKKAHVMAQRALVAAGQTCAEDGVFGPTTVSALNACSSGTWVPAMAGEMTKYYTTMSTQKPALKPLLNDWLKRAAWGV